MIKFAAYAAMPLLLLVFLAGCASLLSYALLRLTGDIWALDKIISKTTQLLLIISIFPLKKRLHLSWVDLGFAPRSLFLRQLFQGFLLSLITLSPVIFTLYALDVQVFDEGHSWTAEKIAEKVGLGLFLALLIALFEEILFRGLLLTSLRQKMQPFAAIAITTCYYAILHFLKSKSSIPYAELTINSGFELLAEAFGNWTNPEIISALTSLLVVGAFLAILRTQIPQSLGLCIGCHCGWVWQIKLSKDFFNVNPQADYLYLVSSYDGVIGPLVSVCLILAMLIFSLINQHRQISPLK